MPDPGFDLVKVNRPALRAAMRYSRLEDFGVLSCTAAVPLATIAAATRGETVRRQEAARLANVLGVELAAILKQPKRR